MIFITGAASAGKSSVIKLLKDKLPSDKFDIHDIDEGDRWGEDYPSWRDAKIEFWLKQSIENRKAGIETILCGIIFPENVAKAASYEEAKPVRYILLDASPDMIQARYLKRMGKWLTRQKEIAGELAAIMGDNKDAHIVDTNEANSDEVMQSIIDQISKPTR